MKGYEVTVDLPNLPSGAEVQVHGLGILKNGETSFVTDAEADHWRAMNTPLVQEFDEKGQMYTYEGKVGTLLQELRKVQGITVETAERPDDTEGDAVTESHTQEQLPLDEQHNEGGEL